MQFGGTTLTALLLGQPPGWLLSISSTCSLLLAWWLTFYSPYDIYWKIINLPIISKIINIIYTFFLYISYGHAITSWGMDKVLFNNFHLPTQLIRESLILSLLTAVLSSNGGGLICNFLSLYSQKSFQINVPTFLQNSKQGDQVRSNLTRSFLLGVIYYIILNPLKLFPWDSLTSEQRVFGHSIIGLFCIFMWLQSQLFSSECNLTGKIVTLLLSLIGITSLKDDIQEIKKEDNNKNENKKIIELKNEKEVKKDQNKNSNNNNNIKNEKKSKKQD